MAIRAFDAYRLSGGVNPLLAVVAFAAETREEAARISGADCPGLVTNCNRRR